MKQQETREQAGDRPRRSWLPWRRRISLNLALQGGGAHGAFTWGVLDRLLDEDWIDLEGISGASAGAINGAVLASGLLAGGRNGARKALEQFWRRVSDSARMGPLQPGAFDYLVNGFNREWSPGYMLFSALTKVASPYQLNPIGFNPLQGLLEREIDFEALRRSRKFKLFIAVTSVHSGQLRILRNRELSASSLTASACLPLLFHAVKLGDQHYWDGGYTANPPLYPLLFECRSRDTLLIQISPHWRDDVPTRVPDIVDRANEVAFNASLQRELQLLALLQRPGSRFPVPGRNLLRGTRRKHLHKIETADSMNGLGRTTRINAEWRFLIHLRDLGRQRTEQWLQSNGRKLGRGSTLDLAGYL